MLKGRVVGWVVITIAAFFAGMWWQSQRYEDLCLDLGGGQNPGGYPICVIEKMAGE